MYYTTADCYKYIKEDANFIARCKICVTISIILNKHQIRDRVSIRFQDIKTCVNRGYNLSKF